MNAPSGAWGAASAGLPRGRGRVGALRRGLRGRGAWGRCAGGPAAGRTALRRSAPTLTL
jgi:hypothetical protein